MAGAFYYLYKFAMLPVAYSFILLSPFILFGLIIRIIKGKLDYLLLERFGRIPYMLFAAIGTPVHELSHLLTSLFFRHKIKRFSLFSINAEGRLGYVEHAYDTNSVWQRGGCFFIGIAPIISGAMMIVLLVYLFMPKFIYPDLNCVPALLRITEEGGLYSFWKIAFQDLVALIKAFYAQFTVMRVGHIAIFALLVIAVGGHMFPSSDDFRGMVPGLLLVYLLIIAAHAAMVATNTTFASVVAYYLPFAAYGAGIMLSIVMVLLASLIVLWVISVIKKLVFNW